MNRIVTCSIISLALFSHYLNANDYTWDNVGGGSWTTAANWSPTGVPAAVDNVSIGLAGSYKVTLPPGQAVNNLTLNSGSATLAFGSTVTGFALNGTATLTAGKWEVNGLLSSTSSITGGTITRGSGATGVLSLLGALRLVNTQIKGDVMKFENTGASRLYLGGTANFVAGSIVSFAYGSTPYSAGSGVTYETGGTLSNTTINLGLATSFGTLGGQTLTIAAGSTVQYRDPNAVGPATVGRGFDDSLAGLIQLNNQGTIRAYEGGELYVGRVFDTGATNPNVVVTNSGLIHAEGGVVNIYGYHGGVTDGVAGFRNLSGGIVRASNGSGVFLFAYDWVNQGTFDATGANSELRLGGRFTTAALGTVTRTSDAIVGFTAARLDNTNANLALTATTGTYVLWGNSLNASAEIVGGTISASGGAKLEIRVLPGVLSGVDYNYLTGVGVGANVLSFPSNFGKLMVRGGTTFTAGDTITLGMNDTELAVAQTGQVDGLTVVLAPTVGNTSRFSVIDNNTLTLGPTTNVRKTGAGTAALGAYPFFVTTSTPQLINQGRVDVQGGILQPHLGGVGTFTNRGTVQIDSGATFAGSFITNTGGRVQGSGAVTGNLTIDVGGSLRAGNTAGQLSVTGNVGVTAGRYGLDPGRPHRGEYRNQRPRGRAGYGQHVRHQRPQREHIHHPGSSRVIPDPRGKLPVGVGERCWRG